jgi:hypothetical protein
MSEPEPRNSRSLGCCLGLIGGGSAFVALAAGVCSSAEGGLQNDSGSVAIMVMMGVGGTALLIYGLRLWRRR